jgi:hypothetical protein
VSEKLPQGTNAYNNTLSIVAALVGMKVSASQTSSLLVRAGIWQHHRIAGSPLEPLLPSWGGNTLSGQVNSLGYGNNAKDWVIRSQAPKGLTAYGEGSETKWWWAGEQPA